MKGPKKVSIVGAGPSGLFSAQLLLEAGFDVDLYDQSTGAAKKFLIAGNGGLNLTHSEDLNKFSTKYFSLEERFLKLLKAFSPEDLQKWCTDLGVETFIGSSGRVFPIEMSAGKILVKWLEKLKSYEGFNLHLKHQLIEINSDKELLFKAETTEKKVKAQVIILALGGGSWRKTGSDGLWVDTIKSLGLVVKDLKPMNCGFERQWSEFFKEKIDRDFLKHVEVTFQGKSAKGDLMLTPYGVEGGVIYALSHLIREEVSSRGKACLSIDLRPALSKVDILKKIENKPKKLTLSNHLRRTLKLDASTFTLLREVLDAEDFKNMDLLAGHIKEFKLEVDGVRDIDEAISTSGGVCFSELHEHLESKKIGGIYFAGEMLDFEAPTGGYLLQAAFSSAWVIANHIIDTDYS